MSKIAYYIMVFVVGVLAALGLSVLLMFALLSIGAK